MAVMRCFMFLLVLFLPELFSTPPDESVATCEKTESGNSEGRPTERWLEGKVTCS